MSEEEPEAYRPRRVWREDQAPADAESTPSADPDPEADRDRSAGPDSSADRDPGADPAPEAAQDPTADQDPAAEPKPDGHDEDEPKPLYRDETEEVGSPGPPDVSASSPGARPELSDETTILSRARARQRSRAGHDPDATTLLPRTAGGSRLRSRDEDDLDDDLEADPRADRRRLLLTIGAVAAVAILGLVAGYAVIKATSQPVAAPPPTTGTGASEPGATPSDGSTSPDSTAIITDQLMLSPAQAETLDRKRTWKVALTQRGTSPDSPNHPACLSTENTEAAPVPQQTVLRLLSSSGSDSPAALHQATSYGTPEEAAQAYAYASRSLGDCAMSGAWIYEGHTITGVGDQAVGVTIQVLDGKSEEFRTVVLARTGRIVDVVDVAKPAKAVSAKRVATVSGDVVDTQCQIAGGACSDEPEAQDGPPPLGGDQPGFLASGDLPPIGPEQTRWAGTTPAEPDPDLLRGSGCETVDWSKVEAESASHRTYLPSDSSSRFGLDEVVVTTKDEAAATKLAEKVRDDWKDCGKRQLTATVSGLNEVKGPGAKSVDVAGWTTEVTQKSDDKTADYRVGIVTAGAKVTFVFLNPQDDLDLTDDQFDIVTVRAGQRATQVN